MQIGEIDLLQRIYQEVIIPTSVHQELTAEEGLLEVRHRAMQLPAWMRIQDPKLPLKPLPNLHAGERAAHAGLVDFEVVLPKLRATNFRGEPELFEQARLLARSRSSAP